MIEAILTHSETLSRIERIRLANELMRLAALILEGGCAGCGDQTCPRLARAMEVDLFPPVSRKN